MKSIQIYFEDEDFKKLLEQKDDDSWREYILSLSRMYHAVLNSRYTKKNSDEKWISVVDDDIQPDLNWAAIDIKKVK